jgi:hypothetical protein
MKEVVEHDMRDKEERDLRGIYTPVKKQTNWQNSNKDLSLNW